MKPKKIEFITRAIVIHKKQILLCRLKKENYYFLPGGHVNIGETARRALQRELKEELTATIIAAQPIGWVENFFINHGRKYHEINLVYLARLKSPAAISQEDHLQFYWLPLVKLKKFNMEPKILKAAILKWLIDKKYFHLIERE